MNPDDYAIIIGLQNYPGINDLGGPENDARAFRDWVVSPTGGGVPNDSKAPDDGAIHLQVLLSSGYNPPPPFRSTRVAHPVVSEIQNAFLKLNDIYYQNIDQGKGPRIGRRLYIYMAGHGVAPLASRAVNQYESALLMADARSNFYGATYHIAGAYTANWFSLNGCFDEIFLFMDCCRSDESVMAINEFLPDERGDSSAIRCYIFGTKWAQNAREKPMFNEDGAVRGVFTKTLLDALSGGAVIADPDQPGQGIITVSSLKGYIYENIGKVLASQIEANANDNSIGSSLDTGTDPVDLQEPDVDYWPRKNDGKDIIILRIPLLPSPVDVPQERDIEFPQTPVKVTLEVRTGDEATEIFVLDSNLERVGRAVGNQAQFELPPGTYTVKVKSGDTQQKQQIELAKKETVTFEPAVFNSPAPLEGTAKTHEFHVSNAAAHSKQKDKELGQGSELYVFVREWTTESQKTETPETAVKKPAKGLKIRSLSGEILVDMASYELPGENRLDPWKACNMELDPGTYLLTLEKPNGDLIQQTITTCGGWQTQVFLLLKDYGKGRNSRRADLANASIYMARLGQGFNPQNNTEANTTARLTDLARRGLVNNRRVLTEETLREVLNSKFENPMLGIMGGHLLLLEEKVNENLLRVVVNNLRRMLGRNHPDVESLAIQANIESDYLLDAPPMLLSSWSILLRASANKSQIIPENSLANDVSDLLWGGSPWLLWTIPNRVTKADAKTRQQQLQEQLNRVIGVQQAPTVAMESMIVDRDIQFVEPAATPSEEELSRLIQTMGLPRCKIEQLIQAKNSLLD